MFEELLKVKELLSGLEFKTVKIGLEKNITSKDVPFLRIVPDENFKEFGSENLKFFIVFGFIVEDTKLEDGYKRLYEYEKEIKKALEFKDNIFFIRTLTDSDLFENFKSATMEFEKRGIYV
jgi:hypothetical protein